ncbi:MAG: O-antigen polymerase [Gaiellaceae bacterium]
MRGKARIPLDLLFSPITITLGLYVPLLLLFLATGSSVFQSEFGEDKSSSSAGLAYLALALLVFGFGAIAGLRVGLRPSRRAAFRTDADAGLEERLFLVLRAALVATIAAYLVWFGLGVERAGGLTALVHEWTVNPEAVKAGALRTIPGVTTLTQLSVAAVPLTLAFGLRRRRGMTFLVGVVFALAVVRSFVFSERLALLELVVPVVYLALSRRVVRVPKAVLVALVSGLAVLALFTATEARRSSVYTHNLSLTHLTARFFGYYLTSENNALVVVSHYPAATPFAYTGEMFWQFPLVDHARLEHAPLIGTVSFRYQDIFHKDPSTFWPQAFAQEGLNYEYNVFTTPGFLAADYGWAGIAVVLLLGLYSGALYKRARTSTFHRALYGVWLVGLLEFMRIMYFFDTRVFPAYILFALLYLALVRRGSVLQWRTSTPRIGTAPVPAVAPAGSGIGRDDTRLSKQG